MNKHKYKRSFLLSISTLLTVCLLSGCSSGSAGSGTDTVKKEEPDPAEVEQKIQDLISAPRFQRFETEEKLSRTADLLYEMAEEGMIQENSVIIHEDLEYVEYRENNGGLAAVDFRHYPEGTASYNIDEIIDVIPEIKDPYTAANIVFYTGFFPTEKENYEYYQEISDYFSSSDRMKGDVRIATVSNLRNGLMNKDMVIIGCHGGLFEYYDEEATFLQAFDETVNQALIDDYENGLLMKVMFEGSKEWHYMMMPSFFSYYYGNNRLDDTIIHLSSCFGFGNDLNDNYVLSDVFLNDCGAEALIGHDQSVYLWYDRCLLLKELEVLEQGGTVREALDAAIAEYGDNDKDFMNEFGGSQYSLINAAHIPAHTGIRGNENARLFAVTETEEPPVKEPEETEETVVSEEPKPDEKWKEEYYAVLSGLSSSYRFALVYIDGDEIPELVVASDNAHVSSTDIYTYYNGKAVKAGTAGTMGEICYIPYQNSIISFSVYGGEANTDILKISSGSLVTDMTFFDNENGAPPENVYYMVNEEKVSAAEYRSRYSEKVPSTLSYAGYSYGFDNVPDQMENVLHHPERVTLE